MRVTANQVTIARLMGLPLIGYMIYGDERTRVVGVIIGTLFGLTDFVDGYLARKYGATVLGSLLDPVADKVFIVVCYGCFADRGGIAWWIAAAIMSRELLVTVLRSSLELRGRRLPSTVIAKAKTWVQMVGFGYLVLIPIATPGRSLPLLFAVPLALLLLAIVAGRLIAGARFRPLRAAAAVIAAFFAASLVGTAATQVVVIVFVVAITWFSALDYLTVGAREIARIEHRRAAHVLRLAGGGLLPIVALAALASDRLPTIPIVLLLSSDMARGALDNYAANLGIADLSWGASLWAEILLLAAALLSPAAGTALTIVAALIGVAETLRSLGKFLRRPSAAEAPVSVTAPLGPPPAVSPTASSSVSGTR